MMPHSPHLQNRKSVHLCDWGKALSAKGCKCAWHSFWYMVVLGTQLLILNVFSYSSVQDSPSMHCAHTRAHTHTGIHTLHPNFSSTRNTPDKDFPCKHSQLVDLSQHRSPDSGPHHALPPWRYCWKVLLGLGCRPHVHMGLNKRPMLFVVL